MAPVVFLMGPTATGKTDIAVKLVQEFPMEIISVDSALVYRGLDIGTAKPDAETLALAPHHLIDICEPEEVYSAARFRDDANEQINAIESRGNIPILVGGTGLYYRALEQGLDPLPAADTSIRQRLDAEYRTHGLQYLYQRLLQVDSQSAQRIDANDPQRIQRALEVYELTGEPMSQILAQSDQQGLQRDIIKLLLVPAERDVHRTVVEQRFHSMLDQGLLNEVRGLFLRPELDMSRPAMRLVGYRQLWQYLQGNLGYDEAVKHAIIATRQLAKRQMTWFRKDSTAVVHNSQAVDKYERVRDTIAKQLILSHNAVTKKR